MQPRTLAFLALSLLSTSAAWAGKEIIDTKNVAPFDPYQQGHQEIQIGVGAFSSFQSTSKDRPGFTDLDAALRYGVMLNTPTGEGFFRGNFELLLAGFAAGLVEGPETGYAGLALVLRYNFVQPEARWIPYFQLQAGGSYNDIYRDGGQRVFGRDIEFDLESALGMRYMCSEHCAVFLEAGYRHISNAGTADRNLGLNSAGGLLGVSFFF